MARDRNQDASCAPKTFLLRVFSLSWTCMLLLLALGLRHFLPGSAAWIWSGAAAVVFAAGLLLPRLAHALYRAVDSLLRPVGEAFSLLLMALVFSLIFTLCALLLRLARRDLLRLGAQHRQVSGWVERPERKADTDLYYQY